MPVVLIDDLQDFRLDIFRDLRSDRRRAAHPNIVSEGLLVTERMLASGLAITAVLTEPRFQERLLGQLPAEVPLYVLSRSQIQELAGFAFHRGVLGCCQRPVARKLVEIIPTAPTPVMLTLCVGIQEPENLGGMIRSSAALGAAAVLLGDACADPYSRRVSRTSMGTNFTMPLVPLGEPEVELAALRDQHDVQLVATVVDGDAIALAEATKPPRVALLLGNEGRGLDERWLAHCNQRVSIDMPSHVDSLNVSVAAGIFLYSYRNTR